MEQVRSKKRVLCEKGPEPPERIEGEYRAQLELIGQMHQWRLRGQKLLLRLECGSLRLLCGLLSMIFPTR